MAERKDPLRGCYFVPGVQVWERHICGKNAPLPEREKRIDVTDKCKILVP